MKPLTQLAHERILAEVASRRTPESDSLLALDLTAGNGHDTRFLAELVVPAGRVWAYDIQPEAIARTRQRLDEFAAYVDLQVADHAALMALIPGDVVGKVNVVMLNLGYLPGGEKNRVTQSDSTIRALDAAVSILAQGGLISVIAYPGHPGGDQEAVAVAGWMNRQLTLEFEAIVRPDPDSSPTSPQLWILRST